MQHNFFYKKIGNISDELLYGLQSDIISATYSSSVDFPPNILTVSSSINGKLLIKLFNNIAIKCDKYYVLNNNSYKKGIFNDIIPTFISECIPYYHVSKQKYLERESSFIIK